MATIRRIVLLCALSSMPLAAAAYSVTVLAVPSGYSTFNVAAINNSGQVVAAGFQGNTEAVFIGNAGGWTMIPMPTGSLIPYGYAINDAGQVAGTVYIGGQPQAFIGTTAGITVIPPLPGLVGTYGFGINNSGQVTGYGLAGTSQGYIGTVSGMTPIAIPAREVAVYGYAINASGLATGYASNGIFAANQAFIGNASSSSAIASPAGWSDVGAFAINASGQIAGYGTNASNKQQAFIGNLSGIAPIPLATGATNGTASFGSVNDTGVVAGTSDAGAWIWDASNGTRLLNTLVPPGWTIVTAAAINNNGTILATASFGGVASSVILTPSSAAGPCDIDRDGKITVLDGQGAIAEALGNAAPGNDLNLDGNVNVVDIQIVANAILNLGCTTGALTDRLKPTLSSRTVMRNLAGSGAAKQAPRATLTATASTPVIAAVVNGASFRSGPIAPGELVAIGGTGLGPSTIVDMPAGPKVQAGGVQVLFDGTPAPMTYVSAGQVNCVVPYEIQGNSHPSIEILYQGRRSNRFPLILSASNPAVFTSDGSGAGRVAAINRDGSLNSPANPAARGSIVEFFVTGEGQTSPSGVTGKVTLPATHAPRPLLDVSALVGGQPAAITSYGEVAGLVSGVMRIAVRIPMDVGVGADELIVSVGGNTSQAGVTIFVR